MIYLFNSAFKPTYFENVYRLVGLPQSVHVDMRYTEGVNAPGVNTDSTMKDRECIICYVDRFADYLYYPFRKGTIRSIKRDQGRVFYNVELAEHCHSDLPDAFTKLIKTSVNASPRLTKDDPACDEDGLYCVDGPDSGHLINVHGNSWSKAVNQIYASTTFKERVPALSS